MVAWSVYPPFNDIAESGSTSPSVRVPQNVDYLERQDDTEERVCDKTKDTRVPVSSTHYAPGGKYRSRYRDNSTYPKLSSNQVTGICKILTQYEVQKDPQKWYGALDSSSTTIT